jgi:hypothetical protein
MDMPQKAVSLYEKYWTEKNHDWGSYPYLNQEQSSGFDDPESRENESCMTTVFVDQEGKKGRHVSKLHQEQHT